MITIILLINQNITKPGPWAIPGKYTIFNAVAHNSYHILFWGFIILLSVILIEQHVTCRYHARNDVRGVYSFIQ